MRVGWPLQLLGESRRAGSALRPGLGCRLICYAARVAGVVGDARHRFRFGGTAGSDALLWSLFPTCASLLPITGGRLRVLRQEGAGRGPKVFGLPRMPRAFGTELDSIVLFSFQLYTTMVRGIVPSMEVLNGA